MPSVREIWPQMLPTANAVQELLANLISERPVRPVVTPSGHRARGYFPSNKARKARFESLVEEDALRVLETAASVLTIQTHPWILELQEAGSRRFRYTPDVFITREDTALLVEVKGDGLLQRERPAANLRRSFAALYAHGIPIVLLTESDVRRAGLQQELKELFQLRPVGGRGRSGIDPTQWDVLGGSQPAGDQLRRWREAQKECDALLERVMRRGPDEAINAVAA